MRKIKIIFVLIFSIILMIVAIIFISERIARVKQSSIKYDLDELIMEIDNCGYAVIKQKEVTSLPSALNNTGDRSVQVLLRNEISLSEVNVIIIENMDWEEAKEVSDYINQVFNGNLGYAVYYGKNVLWVGYEYEDSLLEILDNFNDCR